jgi:hypothetical protein
MMLCTLSVEACRHLFAIKWEISLGKGGRGSVTSHAWKKRRGFGGKKERQESNKPRNNNNI